MSEEPIKVVAPEAEAPLDLRMPEEKKYDPHADWDRVIAFMRQAIIETIAKAKGHSPVTDPIPGYSMEIGTDKHGKPVVPKLRGKYIAYAFDNKGRLSFQPRPTGHGGFGGHRLKKHWRPGMLEVKSTAIALFREEYQRYENEMRAEDAKDGKEFQGITAEEIAPIMRRTSIAAGRVVKARRRESRAARRARQTVSRRINYGMQPGNQDRRNCAAG